MKPEKTPEEAARSKRAHADSMILMGVVTTVAALIAAWIAMSGRGDVPDWLFGGAPQTRAVSGNWTNTPSAVRFADWGPEPFARAKKEGKLVLLFLGPSYSAPTARMEAETFGDPKAAAVANARFVAVRVKSEDYPDLDRRYRAGGWPTTAVLLPDGVPLAAGTDMTPGQFERWAEELADQAASHPRLIDRAEEEAAQARRAAAVPSGALMVPAAAAARARDVLLAQWDPARSTFDRVGARFPRFDRVAALRRVGAPWASDLALEAAKGDLIFSDPESGGFRRAANPDGTIAALEIVAPVQAQSLDALCGLLPAAAGKELAFLDKSFRPKPPPAWRGWLAGYALSPDRHEASDGPDFERWRADGWLAEGGARVGEDADLSRAVLSCAQASAAEKAFARKALDRAWTEFGHAALRHDPRLLLDDALSMGEALLADQRPDRALSVWRWMDANLADGPAFYDRVPTGVLPPEMDQVAYPELNARALAFARELLRDEPVGARQNGLVKRGPALYAWLSARSSALDPAVWAALAAAETR
ncbi:MAG TPA: DUF255 domain-containing protein [Elusimicrobiota bacterium]|jgi:hypothetical protein|nr:DUF255 domain-containing protein [Elusimicrobiota bacterium]